MLLCIFFHNHMNNLFGTQIQFKSTLYNYLEFNNSNNCFADVFNAFVSPLNPNCV